MITCPFKYSGNVNYCSCPYPQGELNWKGPFVSLEQTRILHEIELHEQKLKDENGR